MPQPFVIRSRTRFARRCLQILFTLSCGAVPLVAQSVTINELMFAPAGGHPRQEFIELHNPANTNVSLAGWKFSRGIQFTFPTNTVIGARGYLVLAADTNAFVARYSGVSNLIGNYLITRTTNVVGYTYTNWENTLSNTRDSLRLDNAAGQTVSSLTYADGGAWAVRERTAPDRGYQGWDWYNPADGLGASLERRNPLMPADHGQNWTFSAATNGTPGGANSAFTTNTAPLISSLAHSPLIPNPSETVTITARVLDEVTNPTVDLLWRVNAGGTPPPFARLTMWDDGTQGDGLAGDGVHGAQLPALAQGTIVEFYVEAKDATGLINSWPGNARDVNGANLGHVANALYQVDANTPSPGAAPVFKLILTPGEYTMLGNLLSGSPDSNARFNATFISLTAADGQQVRYQSSVRNRGHGSRFGNPHNYRINFPSDMPWHDVESVNLNARSVHAQHFGAALSLNAGVAGNDSYAALLRINGSAGPGGTPTYGYYAVNEVPDSNWAANHFPNDSGGNIYSVFRDISPPDLTWRGPNPNSYTNTYFKDSNSSENDFTDIVATMRIIGTNDLFTPTNVRDVINVEQWLNHIAIMALMVNQESGLNTGYNDDYELYRGINDPRMILVFHDLDTILNEGDTGGSTAAGIFGSTASNGTGPTMNRFLRHPEFEPLYYRAMQRLLATTFAKGNFDALIDQTLGFYTPANVISRMKTWMDARRTYVQNLVNNYFAANPQAPVATLNGEPRSPTPFNTATLTVGGSERGGLPLQPERRRLQCRSALDCADSAYWPDGGRHQPCLGDCTEQCRRLAVHRRSHGLLPLGG